MKRALGLIVAALVAIPATVYAVAGGEFTHYSQWIQFRAGLSAGPSLTVPGTKLTGKYALFATLDPPSLATTCTNDYFQLSSPGGSYNLGTQPDGTANTGVLGQLALTDACIVTSGTNETAALSHFCRVSTAGGGVDATAVVEVKTCTFGTINGASQKLTLSFEHYL